MGRKSAELTMLICCISVFLLFTENLFSQMRQIIDPDVCSEGKLYEQNGFLYSDAIVVKFKDRVIDLPRGVRYATISDIQPNFPALIGIVNRFKQKVDSVSIVKQIPNAQFGEVTRRHKITGDLVQIHDLSQLYTLRFAKPVPLDSTITEFLKLPEVEFAHEPVSIVYFDSPNDPKYQDGSQWNLAVIKAVAAWDITHGSSTIKIGIVDNGVRQTHEDLQSKIDGGDGVNGDIDHIHGTLVAGVAAAVTNNSKGVASLGWDLRLYTYGNGGNDIGDESFTAQNITAAVDDGVDIINMSFGTLRYATAEDLEPNCSGWVGKLRLPEDYASIATAVNNAVDQGVVCVASAGNASPNEGFQTLCDPISVPFPNYPAQYSGVIALSGTRLVSGVEQFRDGWNYGSFVDVSAPAENIWTTTFQGGYSIVAGTSFAAPLVGALAGLINSVNPSLNSQQIEDIIKITADKIDASLYPYNSNGWNSRLGYGRIAAYQALLMAHAYQNKSVSSTATGSNNGRRKVKTSDNRYHLIFESGITSDGDVLSEIFYRRSNSGGTSWETPVRLSGGNEQNRYASIAERSGQLYVVWQRKTGTNTYDILFRHFNGSSWEANTTITSGISVTSDPLPVIAISTPSASFEMMVVYRTSNGLKSKRSTSTNGSSWASEITVTNSTSARSPSLVYRGNDYGYFDVSWDNGSHVYYRKFFGTSWSNEATVSLNSAANTHEYSSFAAGSTNNRHIVWQATDPSQGNRKVILHNLDLNATIFTKFYSTSNNYQRPSVTGIGSGGALVFWHESSAKKIRYAKFNGSYWEGSPPAGTVYGSGGIEVSAATMNPPASSVKAVWRSSGSTPYTLAVGSALSKNAAFETIVYSRQLIYARDDESVLALRLFAPQITGENKILEFPAVANADSLVAERLAEKLTFDFVVPANAEVAKLAVEIYTTETAGLLQNGASALQVNFELIDLSDNSRAALASVENTDGNTSKKSVTLPLTGVRGKSVRLRPVLAGLDLGKVRGALVHEYGAYENVAPQGEVLASQAANSSHEFSVQAHPNPFNPTTTIQFTLPAAGLITLRIYNLRGQLVRELLHEQRAAGVHSVTWDGRNDRGSISASGVYFLRLESGTQVKVSRLALVR